MDKLKLLDYERDFCKKKYVWLARACSNSAPASVTLCLAANIPTKHACPSLRRFHRKPYRKPLSRLYFAVQDTTGQGQQFFYFASLVSGMYSAITYC